MDNASINDTINEQESARNSGKDAAQDAVIEMRHISKSFPGIKANDDISLSLKRGEIHALLGENGAGKSTLMSILFGLYQADEGKIYKNGEAITIRDPNDATRYSIGMVHQHFKLVQCFTVLENIILGAEPTKKGKIDYATAHDRVMALSNEYQFAIDPDALISEITVGQQQRVEILKMLYRENEILIFDEPTAVLTPQEIVELIAIMRKLARAGKSILFITHKLNEIMEVADRVTVLRKGRLVGTWDVSTVNEEFLAEKMVGRQIEFVVPKADIKPGKEVLQVSHLVVSSEYHKNNAVRDVSFTVREGEIVTIAGIDGNGQTELVYGLTGLRKPSSGSITLLGEDITESSVRKRSLLGMSHIPEDRQKHGLILDFTLAQNLVLQRYFQPPFVKKGIIQEKNIHDYAEHLVTDYDIRAGQGTQTSVRSMSGGNQQKTIVAREIDREPQLLVAVQPVRGLDVGAIEFIHQKIVAARDAGRAVLLVSLELDEVMNVSDRILVMYEGEIVGEFDPKTTTPEELGLYMSGAKRACPKVTEGEEAR